MFGRLCLATTLAAVFACRALGSSSVGDASLFDRLDADKDGTISAVEVTPEHQRLFARLLRRGDADGNDVLSRAEFIEGLVPSRPEKMMEAKLPSSPPQASAVRWLLLSMDTSGNSRVEAAEVPADLRRVFNNMAGRLDTNKDNVLDTMELTRGGPRLAQIAGRYVQQNRIDVEVELKTIERQQGASANRFEARRGNPLDRLADPQQARQIFDQADANRDGLIEPSEVPAPLQRPIERLLRSSDRDGDGRLSQREFLTGARRIAARMSRQMPAEMPVPDAMPAAEPMPADER